MKHVPLTPAVAPIRAVPVAVATLSLLLGGCGRSDAPAAAAARPAATAADDRNLSAEQVAKAARGALRCPPRTTTPPRADGAPVDDVLGVRPGMGYDEAMAAVLCAHELLVATPATGRGFDLKAPQAQSVRQGFTAQPAQARVAKTGRQIVKEMQDEMMARGANAVREALQPGQSRWFVATMGLQGQERVLGVAREERFAADEAPTLASVHEALLKKYGPPSIDQPPSDGRMPLMRWAYDPLGQPVGAGSPLAGRCTGTSDPNGSMQVVPDCGVVVQALLIPQRGNPGLVERLQVGVVNQAAGYRMLTETEQGLAQLDQRRRAQELEKAAKAGKAPSL